MISLHLDSRQKGLSREQELSACQEQRPDVWPLSAATMSSRLETASASASGHAAGRGGLSLPSVSVFSPRLYFQPLTLLCTGNWVAMTWPLSAALVRMRCTRKMRNVVFVVRLNTERTVSEKMLVCTVNVSDLSGKPNTRNASHLH